MVFDLLSAFRKRSADDPPPTESWPLFAFGKLPVYKDFISAGLTDDASREFRDWLSNGFSRHWSTRDDFRSAEIALHAFLLRLPESRKMAAGALWGSTDQGGLRKFPFALFTILPAAKPSASVLTALDYLPVFESRAREIRRKYDAGGTLAAVYQELRGARIEIPVRPQKQIRERLADALARSRVGPLATALFEDDAATQWAALLSGLDAAARRPTAGAAAFRLPLADETSPLEQMKLWTVRLAQASASGAVPAGVLYRTGGAAPRGVLFFRDARAEDILLLHPEAIATDFVEEIPPPSRRTQAQAVARGRARAAGRCRGRPIRCGRVREGRATAGPRVRTSRGFDPAPPVRPAGRGPARGGDPARRRGQNRRRSARCARKRGSGAVRDSRDIRDSLLFGPFRSVIRSGSPGDPGAAQAPEPSAVPGAIRRGSSVRRSRAACSGAACPSRTARRSRSVRSTRSGRAGRRANRDGAVAAASRGTARRLGPPARVPPRSRLTPPPGKRPGIPREPSASLDRQHMIRPAPARGAKGKGTWQTSTCS